MRTEQPTKCFVPFQKLRVRLSVHVKLVLVSKYIFTDRSKVVLLLWFSVACFGAEFGDVSPYVCSYYFSSVLVAEWRPFKTRGPMVL